MAGPVWRREDGLSRICDECLRETTTAYLEGRVLDATFHPYRQLCPACYATNGRLLLLTQDDPFRSTVRGMPAARAEDRAPHEHRTVHEKAETSIEGTGSASP